MTNNELKQMKNVQWLQNELSNKEERVKELLRENDSLSIKLHELETKNENQQKNIQTLFSEKKSVVDRCQAREKTLRGKLRGAMAVLVMITTNDPDLKDED